jgi:hypothetical protein
MYFDKDNNKKNHKITFSITLAILVVAIGVLTLAITQNAFAADPITNCFGANAPINSQDYLQEVGNFVRSLPNDQVLTNIASSVYLGPIKSPSDLWTLFTNPSILSQNKGGINQGENDPFNQAEREVGNLLSAAGFDGLHKAEIRCCIDMAISPTQSCVDIG